MSAKTLPPMMITLLLLGRLCFSQEPAIFANDRYTFYPDRMESFDQYQGVYRSATGLTICKDGATGSAWDRAHTDKLCLQTPYPILDAAFFLAVDETLRMVAPAGTKSAMLEADQPGGKYYHPFYLLTHGTDIREYTRDSAQHIEWGDSVILDRATAWGTIIRRCDLEHKRLREDAVVTADNVHLIRAVWEYFKITGDKAGLAQVWDCMWNEMALKEAQRRQADGLWTGSPWSDAAGGFLSPEHFRNRNTQIKSLYANTMVAGAWQALADIAKMLGKPGQSALAAQKFAAMKAAINAVLFRPELGTYCYYKCEADQSCSATREDISAGLIYLFGIADKAQALAYHDRFKPTAYGYRNLDPVMPSGEASYHGGNVWENQEVYHGWMLAKLGRADDLRNFLFWHARAGLVIQEWREGTINPSTGNLHSNYKHLIWGSMGYTAYWTRGVFGISYDLDDLRFAPCVPARFGDAFYAVLNNFTYRDGALRLILRGSGCAVERLLLDGNEIAVVPSDLKGPHTVEILMRNHRPTTIPQPLAK
jgi:hypothetical protein